MKNQYFVIFGIKNEDINKRYVLSVDVIPSIDAETTTLKIMEAVTNEVNGFRKNNPTIFHTDLLIHTLTKLN